MPPSTEQFSRHRQILKSIYQGKLRLAENLHLFDGCIFLSEEHRLEHLKSWYATKIHSQPLVNEARTETVKLLTDPDISLSSRTKVFYAPTTNISLSSYLQNFREYFVADGSCFVVVCRRIVDAILFQPTIVNQANPFFNKIIQNYVEFSASEAKKMEQYPGPMSNEQTRFLHHNVQIIRDVYDIEKEYLNIIRMLSDTTEIVK